MSMQAEAGSRKYKIICSSCGKEDEVPFEPTPGRDVFCRACFSSRKRAK
jgi:CxxC-x17-CxxC domain-containing protein